MGNILFLFMVGGVAFVIDNVGEERSMSESANSLLSSSV
jgi:hypothetical protein